MRTSMTNYERPADTSMEIKVSTAKENISLKDQWRFFIAALFVSDFVLLSAAFWLSYFIRFELSIPLFELWVVPSLNFYKQFMLVLILIWMGVFAFQGLYSRDKLLGGTSEYSSLFNGTTIGVVLVVAVGFFHEGFFLARGWLFMAWVLGFLFTMVGRFSLRRVVYAMRRSGYFLSPALIIGANDEGKMLSEQLRQWKSSGFHVVGFVDKKLHVGDQVTKDLRVLGKMEELDQVIEKYNISEIILASSAVSSRDKMIEIFKKFAFSDQVNVRFSSGLYEIITTGLEVNKFAYVPLMGVSPVRLSGIEQALKLILDYLIASIAIVVLSPILVVAAIAIKLDSPGPILHRRRIIGLNGKEFDAFKFRSMRTDGEKILAEYPELQKELEENHKLKHDPRITRIGRFVRRTSIDELPQFFNVLRGEMSVVGPRMITPDEIAKYDQWDVNLLTVKPGITGLWQISGRSDVTYEERVRLDMYYIRNWNIWLDTQIIIQTIPAVIKGKGAY